jgi:hypothetical protein
VAQKKALIKKLEAERRDHAIAQKALVGEREAEGLVVDPLTNDVFREISIVLDVGASGFAASVNAPGTLSIIAAFVVPNGIALYFRAVKSDVDRNAPYLYGQLSDGTATTLSINGTVRVRVFDATLNQLKGQPFTGSAQEIFAASPVNWFERLFFNSRVPVRANSGDQVVVDIVSASIVSWTFSSLVMHLIQLTKQA